MRGLLLPAYPYPARSQILLKNFSATVDLDWIWMSGGNPKYGLVSFLLFYTLSPVLYLHSQVQHSSIVAFSVWLQFARVPESDLRNWVNVHCCKAYKAKSKNKQTEQPHNIQLLPLWSQNSGTGVQRTLLPFSVTIVTNFIRPALAFYQEHALLDLHGTTSVLYMVLHLQESMWNVVSTWGPILLHFSNCSQNSQVSHCLTSLFRKRIRHSCEGCDCIRGNLRQEC